ncbi:MAG: hypothetical protein QE271_02260 [Bacteriovoracaceae bacterium]|nr:hypothetical protein [Bacteriovoracaceae bacterium]
MFSKAKRLMAIALMAAPTVYAQTSGTTLETKLPGNSRTFGDVPVSVQFSNSYRTNLDGIEKGKFNPYESVNLSTFGFGARFDRELSSRWSLKYNPNADVTVMDDNEYVKSSDRVRSYNFNNRFNFLYEASKQASLGPFAVVSYNNAYTYNSTGNALVTFKRDRTLFNYGGGMMANLQPASSWKISTEASVIRNDNSGGNYRNREGTSYNDTVNAGRNDTRTSYLFQLNNEIALSKNVTFTSPSSYLFRDFSNRLARNGSLSPTLKEAFVTTKTAEMEIVDVLPTLTLALGSFSISGSYGYHHERQAVLATSINNLTGSIYSTGVTYDNDYFSANAGYSYRRDHYRDAYVEDINGDGAGDVNPYYERVHTTNSQLLFKKIFASPIDATLSHNRESQRWYDGSEYTTYETTLGLSASI